jgi:hypothetical protein
MRYAGGRPLWQISIALWRRNGSTPVPVLSWSPNAWRKAQAIRDDVMRGQGTKEPWFMENMVDGLGVRSVSVNWRKPLTIEEINQLTPTAEVRERQGRS